MSWQDYYPPTRLYRELTGTADDDDDGDEWPDDVPTSAGEYDQGYEPEHYTGGCKCCGYDATQPGQICSVCGVQSG